MNQPLTKHDLKQAVQEIVVHFNKGQGLQNEQIGNLDTRLTSVEDKLTEVSIQVGDIGSDVKKIKLAVVDLLGTDRHLHNLVGVLKREGVKLNEREIFAN